MIKLKNEELNRLSVEDFKQSDKTPIVIILDNVRSLNNIGSIFRTADAFRLSAIYLCGITATPPHKDIQKTALGATETVDWFYFENVLDCINNLKDSGYNVYAIEQATESINLIEFVPKKNEKYAFVMGNEVEGVDQNAIKNCNGCIELPQYGSKHSLNIAVCTGIVIWDVFCKLNK